MSKLISSFFTSSGVPTTGLSPTMRIWEVTPSTNTLVVAAGAMVEVGDGFYKYEFTTYDPTLDYLFRSDGGVALPIFERYQKASSRNSAADTWNQQLSDFTDTGTFGLSITTALAVLDLLVKFESNRTRVDPVANTLTVYDDDGTTPLQVFDLKDETGAASADCVYERDPV